MATYIITFVEESRYEVEVEATSEKEAKTKFQEIDSDQWILCDNDIVVYEVHENKE